MSRSVWIGRVNKSATYEELWAFLVENCGQLESLEWVAHKRFAIAEFVSGEDAAKARCNQSLEFQGSTLWMDEVWSKDSSQKSRKYKLPANNPAPAPISPKKTVLKRNAIALNTPLQSRLPTTTASPVGPRTLFRPQPNVQVLRPITQRARPAQYVLRSTKPEYTRPDVRSEYISTDIRPVSRPISYSDTSYDQVLKRRREDIGRVAPNFSISIDNTGVSSWNEEDSEQALNSRYKTSSSRFEAYSQLPAYAERRSDYQQPLEQSYSVHSTPGVTTYYADYGT